MSKTSDKLHAFLKDCLRVGCLRGFQHFSLYLRGREELMVTIHSEVGPGPQFAAAAGVGGGGGGGADGFGMDLPPASPLTLVSSAGDAGAGAGDTVYLIGGYARYKCPFVWLRSANAVAKLAERSQAAGEGAGAGAGAEAGSGAAGSGNGAAADPETPLKLATTDAWQRDPMGTKVWDIIAELIDLSMEPRVVNPFAIDRVYFDELPQLERVLAAGAMAQFLTKVHTSAVDSPQLQAEVMDDIRFLFAAHFDDLPNVLT